MAMRRKGTWASALPALLVLSACGQADQASNETGNEAEAATVPQPIELPGERLFPENLDIAADGTAYVGSLSGGVLRVDLPSRTVSQWLAPGAYGSASTFGILVDPVNRLIWVCSNNLAAQDIVIAGADAGAFIKGFDPATGEGKVSLALPGEGAICNDAAVAGDGTLYVSDSGRSHILRWRPGASVLEDWFFDQRLASQAHENGGLDGIAFDRDGNLIVNNFRLNVLGRITISPDGSPGEVTMLESSRPLETPDGLRPLGDGRFVLAESGGKVSLVTIAGEEAEISTLGEGFGAVSGVAPHDGYVWQVAGEAAYVFRPDLKGKSPPLPFTLSPIRLP